LRINDVRGYSDNSILRTLATTGSDDTPINKVGGLIRPIRRKVVKKKAKAVAEDPMLELMTKEFSILRTTKVMESNIFV